MNAPDLDQLRARWAEQGRRIDDRLVLDVDAVRATLARKTSAAFAWHRRRRVLGLAVGGSCVAVLLAFITMHWGQWDWVKLAGLLLPLLIAEIAIDLREWLTLRRLDLGAPVMQVRGVLDRLRWRRLRLAKGYMLFSVLLWWPFVLVLFKILFGADLLRWLPPIVLLANLAVGLAFIPVALATAWCLDRWFGHTAGWQRFLDDAAGKTWRRASDEYAVRETFEAAVADGSVEEVLASNFIPEEIHDELRALRRHLLVGILGCGMLVALFGLFNVTHGGQVHFIVSGTLLLWGALAHMVVQILNRDGLSRSAGGALALRERLAGMMTLRRRVAMATIVLSPLVILPLAVVVAQFSFGVDLVHELSTPTIICIVLLALSASVLLWRRIRRDPAGFAPRLVDALCLGFPARAHRLLAELPVASVPEDKQGLSSRPPSA